ncbi:2-polyprenyl-6-methoxyphenol hydroxylase-like oxidoreductase [Micractinium conductrix]|uniref:2-polyprenyl-6-methoxyphenol hydroxylase-like oxidoreductase n=1 Tax=Micractinium conductrix TaxID=554055 RepID=A0A2P6VQC8_9CHLO|nr:2-polyprenyl-6-methoxyphenol hydroxylase-like oxidoreductase [Micractinium conductrix]|eukprot:PSC76304.1 2-polyprenyl-6-methoxyphenol hydroxylase-like oxidoreductase [Micractinium conductrix]
MYDYQRDFRRGESEVRGVLGTRALIEQTVRSMLLEQERGVQLRSAAPVAGLLFEGGGGSKQLTGVKLKGGEVLATDLVVDASGRSSQTADWMAAAGLQPPPKLMVDAKLGYATRFYERPADYSGPPAALVGGRPMFTRGAVLIPVEGNSWQLILGGYAGDHHAAGRQAAQRHQSLPWHQEPGRCYDKVDMPEGLVVMGDAHAAFNPIYGQGITTDVLQSEALKEAFQKRAAAVVDTPWTLAISEDSKWPIAESNYEVPQTAALLRPYFAALAVAASQDDAVFAEWARVLHMLKPPTAFFSPFMLLKTLQYAVLLPFLRRLPLVGRLFPGAAPAVPAEPASS